MKIHRWFSIGLALVVALVVVLSSFGCAAPKPAPTPTPTPTLAPIVLKAVCPFPMTHSMSYILKSFAERVEKQSQGRLKVQILGGPEVIDIFDQPEAVRAGNVDLIYTFQTTYEAMVPETIPLPASEITPAEERERGFNDWLIQVHKEKMNVYFMGRGVTNVAMYTWSKKQVNSLNDLKGQKLGLTPVWFAFAEALGCVPVLMFEPDLYTGLSRGVIDGYMCPPDSVTSLGLQTETKSLIDQSFWEPCNGVFIMNWAKWDSLPGDLKNLINEIMPQLEVDLGTYYGNALEQEKQKAIAAGVKPVKLSPEETQKYLDLANKVVWDKTKEKNSPESYAKLREFLTK